MIYTHTCDVKHTPHSGGAFGKVLRDVPVTTATPGTSITVEFQSASPRNDIRRNGTFMHVERLNDDSGDWDDVATDADLSTRVHWRRPGPISLESIATVEWKVPDGTQPGTYRIKHYGTSKSLSGALCSFVGVSSPFRVARGGVFSAAAWWRGV